MTVNTILNSFLNDVTPSMHKVRRTSLNAMVTSLMSGAPCSVTGLGKNSDSNTSEKHQIKRSMRLCSHRYLQGEIGSIYSLMTHRLIGQQQRPVILVDWSDVEPGKQHFLFRASLAVEDRSLTVLEQIYPVTQKEKPAVHTLFMTKLKSLLPPRCKPIIVSNPGFRVPWFRLIESLGWHYVGRVRNRTFCQSDKDYEKIQQLIQEPLNV